MEVIILMNYNINQFAVGKCEECMYIILIYISTYYVILLCNNKIYLRYMNIKYNCILEKKRESFSLNDFSAEMQN